MFPSGGHIVFDHELPPERVPRMVFSALRKPAKKVESAANRLVPSSTVVSTMHGTRTVLLDTRKGRYWSLDEVGSRMWALADAGHSIDRIVDELTLEYDAPPERLRADTLRFFQQLLDQRLIEIM